MMALQLADSCIIRFRSTSASTEDSRLRRHQPGYLSVNSRRLLRAVSSGPVASAEELLSEHDWTGRVACVNNKSDIHTWLTEAIGTKTVRQYMKEMFMAVYNLATGARTTFDYTPWPTLFRLDYVFSGFLQLSLAFDCKIDTNKFAIAETSGIS
ncbi:hypothetical protein GCK32_018579 [Trichostrongylus colubriformis]|uniref:Uncharacterized protein n=1 Tax=Trichostrongylus colubriformis TaxID=6319 RepID=A0AAN8F5J5_TRICO